MVVAVSVETFLATLTWGAATVGSPLTEQKMCFAFSSSSFNQILYVLYARTGRYKVASWCQREAKKKSLRRRTSSCEELVVLQGFHFKNFLLY